MVRRRRTDETASVPEARPAPEEPVDPPGDDEVDGDQPSTVEQPAAGLDERGRKILEFERQWWKHAGAKEQAIRDAFGLSATRYYQVLNALLDDPAALAHDPTTVSRLRRLRASRTARTRRPT